MLKLVVSGRGCERHHGGRAGAHHALRRRRLRQRVDRADRHVHNVLLLVPRAAPRQACDRRKADAGFGHLRCRGGHRVHLHGRRVGGVRLRAQHDRSARCCARRLWAVHVEAAPRLLSLLPDRHVWRHARARGRPGAAQVTRAARTSTRVCRFPDARVLRSAAAQAPPLHPAAADAAHQDGHPSPDRPRRRRRRPLPHGLLRPSLRARARPLCQAHTHRQPARRLGRRAPARKRAGVPALPPPHLPPGAVWLWHLAAALERFEPVPRALRARRLPLLQQDGASDHPSRPCGLRARRGLPRLPLRPAAALRGKTAARLVRAERQGGRHRQGEEGRGEER
mmetsp:Transcript_17286/g.37112  ORF Transcript_17286/g.37112 Transcript_17286/m.37112 type:complete len:338 (+) Transcript_17286:452-1465(+)